MNGLNKSTLSIFFVGFVLLVGLLPFSSEITNVLFSNNDLNYKGVNFGGRIANSPFSKNNYAIQNSEFKAADFSTGISNAENLSSYEPTATLLVGATAYAARKTYTVQSYTVKQNHPQSAGFSYNVQQVMVNNKSNNTQHQASAPDQLNLAILGSTTEQGVKAATFIPMKIEAKAINPKNHGFASLSTDLSSINSELELASNESEPQKAGFDPGGEPPGDPIPVGDGIVLLMAMMGWYVGWKIIFRK